MFCKNCGTKLPDDALFCESCGTKVSEEKAPEKEEETVSQPVVTPLVMATPTISEPSISIAKATFSKPIALVLAIVTSCATALTFASGQFSNILLILLTISTWIMWANARSSKDIKTGPFILDKVITTFVYVINWIAVGVLALVTIAAAFLSAFLVQGGLQELIYTSQFQQFIQYLNNYMLQYNVHINMSDIYSIVNSGDETLALIVAGSVILAFILSIAIIIVINLVFIRRFKIYTSSLVKGAKSHEDFPVYDKKTAIALLVYGILTSVCTVPTALSIISTKPLTSLASIAVCALPILAFCVINGAPDKNK